MGCAPTARNDSVEKVEVEDVMARHLAVGDTIMLFGGPLRIRSIERVSGCLRVGMDQVRVGFIRPQYVTLTMSDTELLTRVVQP